MPQVIGMHFVCRSKLNVRHLENGSFESGFWKVDPRHASNVRYVYLHETRAQTSYLQGEVVGCRTETYQGKRRFVFTIRPTEGSEVWVGKGTGEKGYAYQ